MGCGHFKQQRSANLQRQLHLVGVWVDYEAANIVKVRAPIVT